MLVEVINKETNKVVELSDEEYRWLLAGFRFFACHFSPETWGHDTRIDFDKKFKELRATYIKLTGDDIC